MRSLPFYSCTKVSTFDIIAVASDDSESAYTSFKALRVLRALRLIKLVRLVRASRIIKRWETHFAINYTWLSIMQSGMSCILCAHWMACVWGISLSGGLRKSPSSLGSIQIEKELHHTTSIGSCVNLASKKITRFDLNM